MKTLSLPLLLFTSFFILTWSVPALALVVDISALVPGCGDDVVASGEQCDAGNFNGNYCPTFGFSGGSLGCTASCRLDFSGCTSGAENSETTFFPSSGGAYTLINDDNTEMVISVPSGAYQSDLTLTAFVYPAETISQTNPPPDGKVMIGQVYDLNLITEDGVITHTTDQPLTISIEYSDEAVAGLDENTLVVYRQETGDTSWHLIAGSVVDPLANTVTFSTDSFSLFALLATAPIIPSSFSPTTSAGSGGQSSAFRAYLASSTTAGSFVAKELTAINQTLAAIVGPLTERLQKIISGTENQLVPKPPALFDVVLEPGTMEGNQLVAILGVSGITLISGLALGLLILYLKRCWRRWRLVKLKKITAQQRDE